MADQAINLAGVRARTVAAGLKKSPNLKGSSGESCDNEQTFDRVRLRGTYRQGILGTYYR